MLNHKYTRKKKPQTYSHNPFSIQVVDYCLHFPVCAVIHVLPEAYYMCAPGTTMSYTQSLVKTNAKAMYL